MGVRCVLGPGTGSPIIGDAPPASRLPVREYPHDIAGVATRGAKIMLTRSHLASSGLGFGEGYMASCLRAFRNPTRRKHYGIDIGFFNAIFEPFPHPR